MKLCACHGVQVAQNNQCVVKRREAQRRYGQSEKGRATRRRYADSEGAKDRQNRYNQSPKGRLRSRRYRRKYCDRQDEARIEEILDRYPELEVLDGGSA